MVETATRLSGIDEAVAAIRDAKRITAICHENPDADTIAGAIAVALMAGQLGKEFEVVSVDPLDPGFDFLPGFADVRTRPALEPDLAVVCDAATLERVGRLTSEAADWLGRARLLNIDHHVTNTSFGDVNLVDPAAAATCEVIVGLVDPLGVTLDAPLATALLAGIVRDSNGFADASTSPRTLRATARLVEAGAPLADVYRRIHHEMPTSTMALWGRLLHAMREADDGRIIWTVLTPEMLAETGTAQHDADGVAEFMAKGRGVEASILLRALGPAETRVSVRTSPALDATTLVAPFGGGGHARRAGCTIAAAADEASRMVVDVCSEALRAADGRTGQA